MTEIPSVPPPPPLQRPFETQPRQAPGGCGTPLLIGCGVLAVLLGLGAIFFVVKAKSLLAYTMEKLEAQVVANLPEEVDPAGRERLATAFAGAVARVRSGEIDPALLQEMQGRLVAAAERAPRGTLTAADVAALTETLERFAAGPTVEAPAPEATPAAAATP
jgi:hypothetical protein